MENAIHMQKKSKKSCFHGGRLFESIGLDYSNMNRIDLSYAADVLDAWYPPAPKVVKKISKYLAWGIRTSPPPTNQSVINLIAETYKLDPLTVVVGAGSSELIYRVLPSLIDNRGVLIPKPAYGEYEHIIKNLYNFPVYEMYTDHVDFKIDLQSLVNLAVTVKPSAIVLINPSNPSGKGIERNQILEFLKKIAPDVNLIVDETYSEYNKNADSVVNLCLEFKNLVVFKSLSKTFALSGLRAGFCVLHASRAQPLSLMTPPYIIPTLTQIALYQSFKNLDYYERKIQETHEIKKCFLALLEQHAPAIKPVSSIINSFLLDVSATNIKASEFVELLAKNAIYVRNIDSQGLSELGKYIRVSILKLTDMEIIAQAIGDIVQNRIHDVTLNIELASTA